MALSISRQIKLRSVEQSIFSPSFNRLNFFIQPDGLSTDLSQSYLSMRVYLTNSITGTRLTSSDMQSLISQNLVISFGNGDQSYSPACLIRVARLFANKGNQLLEECNFANVLTQTIIHQLCNDFETLESNNLLTGCTSQIGHGSSMPASLSAFINNPTEIHIYLRDLFGVCRHSNFELMSTDGLNITLELEDKQNLFRVTTLGDFQRINVMDVSGATVDSVLPKVFVNPALIGYKQNSNTMGNTPISTGQFQSPSSNLFVDAAGNPMIQHPKEGFVFGAEYFLPIAQGVPIDTLTMASAYDADQLVALGFVSDAFLKLRFSISSSFTAASNVAPKEFTFMARIGTTTPGTNPVIGFNAQSNLWWDNVPGLTINNVVALMDIELLNEGEVFYTGIGTNRSSIQVALAGNQLILNPTEMTFLQQQGILDTSLNPTGCTFDIGVQMFSVTPSSATAGTHIMPDIIVNENSPTIRQIYSNQLTKLPTQGAKAFIKSIVPSSGNYIVTFDSWGCESQTSIQGSTIRPTANGSLASEDAVSATIFIWNVQDLYAAPNNADVPNSYTIPTEYNTLSYEIDKFEIVLIQQSINPQNRMPSPFVYSTWKLETATIETAQATYARQFILEENVYNCFLLTPQWNDQGAQRGSLISSKRGVSYYRYSVNQVNQTNRDIYISNFRSYYPSSLYLDRLSDTFSNSEYTLRSPVGIKGVQETASPVLCYPLKIYHAISENAYTLGHPGGATVQINMFADTSSGGLIQPGNIFLFKQVLKQLM